MLKISIQSLKDYFFNKIKQGKQPIFFEKIGDNKTTREEMLKNLIESLEKNGWKCKDKEKK